MEEYPEELRMPPVPLVCLVGVPELHSTISNFLLSEHPPINTLALPDFAKISVIAKREREKEMQSLAGGVLKSGWLIKHRTRVPAIVAALFSREDVYGDPSQWLQVCGDLDNLKNVIHGRNTKLVVVIIQSSQTNDLNEDRLVALRKRAEVDAKCFLFFSKNDASEMNRSLARIGSIFAELASTFYKEEGRKIKLRIEKRGFSCMELNVRYNFKVAVYAEFRRDWAEALKYYEAAYAVLQEMFSTSAELLPIQRLIEIKVVAEQIHFKILTLLMHGGKGVDAVKWFRHHISLYKHLVGRQEVVFLHWEWVCRQYTVFAEFLQTGSSGPSSFVPPVTGSSGSSVVEMEQQAGYYYELAAKSMKERRASFSLALEILKASGNTRLGDSQISSKDLSAPLYVGQHPQILEHSDSGVQARSPTEEEYLGLFIAEEKSFRHSHFIIDAFTKAYEQYQLLKARRMSYHVACELGQEYFFAQEYAKAKKLFEGVAVLYRQEAWSLLLWSVLGYLKECARHLGLRKEYIENSLEMATLPIFATQEFGSTYFQDGPVPPCCHSQRIIIQDNVFKLLRGMTSEEPVGNSPFLSLTDSQPLALEIDVVSPLRGLLVVHIAFHQQSVKPGAASLFSLALLTHLPKSLQIDKLEFQFNQSQCNFQVISEKRRDLSKRCMSENIRFETVPDLDLNPDKWKRMSFEVDTGLSGKLECLSVVAHVGSYLTICSRAESPASRQDLPFWKFEDGLESCPMEDGNLSFFGQKFIQVEEPDPLVDMELKAKAPGFVGEAYPVLVFVICKGHAIRSAELKINVVDSKFGSTSRENTSASGPSFDVDLLMSQSDQRESGVMTAPDENIGKLSGVLSIPDLEAGMKWSTVLYVRWHKPKIVKMFVSLGYHCSQQDTKDETLQKVHVHKSLHLEGRNAFTVRQKYMLPFRRDTLLLTDIKKQSISTSAVSLPLNENNVLVVSAKNSSDVPLRLLSFDIKEEDHQSCSVQHARSIFAETPYVGKADSEGSQGETINTEQTTLSRSSLLMPNDIFTETFTVRPFTVSPELCVGNICIRWKRDEHPLQSLLGDCIEDNKHPLHADIDHLSTVLTEVNLAPITVDKPSMVVMLKCPSYAVLGNPFTFCINIQNETCQLQEIKFSVVDSQSFLLSGAHSDTISVLPYSSYVLLYKLIPLASGPQQLPHVILTALRYSVGFNPSPLTTQLFIFPSQPYLTLDSSRTLAEGVNKA